MAGTYYGYAERNADAYVDWREVSQYTTDMLDETMRLRQEKKDALNKVAKDALKFAANAPVGADVSVRKKALVMSDMVSKNILMMKKKMENGDLDPRDWLIYQQNALDTIDLSFNAFKIYQEDYASTMEGIKNKELSILTAENIGFAETYGNLETLGFTMSPEGNILMGKEVETEVDGQKVKKLEGITSVNALNGLIANKINHNKIEDQVNTYVKSLGVEKRAVALGATFDAQGQVKTIEDIRSRKSDDPAAFQFREAELEQARAMIGDSSNIASILIDTKKVANNGKEYTTTIDENEAKRDPSKILRVFIPNKGYNIVVSKEQEQDALDFTLNRMRERYKYEEEINVGSQTQRQWTPEYILNAGKTAAKEKEFARNLAQNLVTFMTGNDQNSVLSGKYLSGVTNMAYNKTPGGANVVNKDNKQQNYQFDENNVFGGAKALIGSIKANLPDEYKNVSEDVILKYVKEFLPQGAKLNKTASGQGFEPKPQKQTALQQFSSYIDNAMTFEFKPNAAPADVAATLNRRLAGTGFEVKSTIVGDNIYIVKDSGKGIPESPEFPAGTTKKNINALQNALKWMKANLPSKKIGDVKDKEAYAAELIESGFISGGLDYEKK